MQARDCRIDVLRVVSSFFVVVIHVVSSSVTYSDIAIGQSTVEGLNTVHNLSKWVIPVFFMISGFCILGNDRECTWQWVLRHIGKFVGILFTFGWFYALLEHVYVEKTIAVRTIGLAFVDVLNGKSWEHMWYIYSIIGIYLVLPIVKAYIVQNERNVYYLSGLLFLSTIVVPEMNNCLHVSIDLRLPMSGYLFYVIVGAMIARCRLTDMGEKYMKLAMSFVGAVMFAYFLFFGGTRDYAYTSLPVCVMAVSLFAVVAKSSISVNTRGGGVRCLSVLWESI